MENVTVYRGSTGNVVSVNGEAVTEAEIGVLRTASMAGLHSTSDHSARKAVSRLIKLDCLLPVGAGMLQQVQITQRGYEVLRAVEAR